MSDLFRRVYGGEPEFAAAAPGRVNLIGEHTDYNGGYVLPTAIPQRTVAEIRRRGDRTVRAWSASVGEHNRHAGYELGQERPSSGWSAYVAGVTWALAQRGLRISGFDLGLDSTVPLGAGLSSSAALEVALLRALRTAFQLPLDDVRIAQMGQVVENEFVGARVGIMDQMAVSLAGLRQALFLDARSLEYELVPIPASFELVAIHSGVSHSHAGGEYNARREECERASALLGVTLLRDLPASRAADVESLPDPERKRARHVLSENERVLRAVRALREEDGESLGRLFNASHESLQGDYEVTIPEIDLLVESLRVQEGVFGARMTGGGFGGSVVALVRQGRGPGAAAAAAEVYRSRTGRSPTVIMPEGERPEGIMPDSAAPDLITPDQPD